MIVIPSGRITLVIDEHPSNALYPISVTVDAIPLSPNARATVSGNTNLEVGSNIVLIDVTNGDNHESYSINVVRQEMASTSNYLTGITTNRGDLSPEFVKTKLYYSITLDNEITSIRLDATLEDPNATLEGTGIHSLSVGSNILPITVTSTDGIRRIYQVEVIRRASSNSKLSRLSIDNVMLSPSFDKDIYSYSTDTRRTSLNFLEIVPVEPSATYQVLNNNLSVGANNVIVRVTAPDGVTVSDYVIHVNRTQSNNNNLSYLSIDDVELDQPFNKGTTLYYASVPSNVRQVNINAIPRI